MIRHVVLVHLRPDLPSTEVEAVFGGLAALRERVAGMKAFAHGPNVSPEGLARGSNYAFTVDFEDAAARDAYLALPEHEAAGARLVRASEGGLGGLTVVDFELP